MDPFAGKTGHNRHLRARRFTEFHLDKSKTIQNPTLGIQVPSQKVFGVGLEGPLRSAKVLGPLGLKNVWCHATNKKLSGDQKLPAWRIELRDVD